jgi:hypothetical protein
MRNKFHQVSILERPGSDSSALHTKCLGFPDFINKAPFQPAGKPAPPRPRSPDNLLDYFVRVIAFIAFPLKRNHRFYGILHRF